MQRSTQSLLGVCTARFCSRVRMGYLTAPRCGLTVPLARPEGLRLHMKYGAEAGEDEQPSEAQGRINEDEPSVAGSTSSMCRQEGTKSGRIDEGQPFAVDQNIAVDAVQ